MIPGLIDAHTHIPMTLFRGLADDLPLHTWLEQHVWPAEHRFINPETVRWASRLGCRAAAFGCDYAMRHVFL